MAHLFGQRKLLHGGTMLLPSAAGRRTSLVLLLVTTVACAAGSSPHRPFPRQHAATRTAAAITPADLSTRLYAYADDSMLGRSAGTLGNVRATAYLAREVQRLGLEPAGDSGTYFQTFPLDENVLDSLPRLSVVGVPLVLWRDYQPISFSRGRPFGRTLAGTGLPTIYGGRLGDTTAMIPAALAAGKVVVLAAPPAGTTQGSGYNFWTWAGINRYPNAAVVVITALDVLPPEFLRDERDRPRLVFQSTPEPTTQTNAFGILVTSAAAARLLGAPLKQLRPGALGQPVDASLRYVRRPARYPARNVVAILRGSDPALRHEYVAIGAHNDHIGMTFKPADHDSIRAFNAVFQPMGAEGGRRPPPDSASLARFHTLLDSLRRVHPARLDSVFNGADDDGSGSVSVLELAEKFAGTTPRPKRSILFVWHTGEEKGLWGSTWFTDHPTVPREAIVAQLNIDMVGRGDTTDVTGTAKDGQRLHGNPDYVQLIGSRRLSTELGDLVERVNAEGNHGLRFDYALDADGHPANMYCRSDHYSYARYGIPVVFFTTGVHQDYHQLTDEPQYINYPHMARVVNLVYALAGRLADLDHRVVVDKPKPDPQGDCQQ